MKSTFGKTFGFVFGIYAGCVAINLVDYLLPKDICFYKDRRDEKVKTED